MYKSSLEKNISIRRECESCQKVFGAWTQQGDLVIEGCCPDSWLLNDEAGKVHAKQQHGRNKGRRQSNLKRQQQDDRLTVKGVTPWYWRDVPG